MRLESQEIEELEDYFQDELDVRVLVDDSAPGYVTLFALCACGGIIAKAVASTNLKTITSGYERAFRSLVRQVGEHKECLPCRNALAPAPTVVPTLHNNLFSNGGHVPVRRSLIG